MAGRAEATPLQTLTHPANLAVATPASFEFSNESPNSFEGVARGDCAAAQAFIEPTHALL
jgi:hypothetical protein